MPRIWADTIDSHRRQVTDAILDVTAELIAEQGLLSVAMSRVAERAGIGRATLYKYFPDIESIVVAWHTREFGQRLEHLEALGDSDDLTLDDLIRFVCTRGRHHSRHRGADMLSTLAHNLANAEGHVEATIEPAVTSVLSVLLAGLARRGEVRDDHAPELLARWLFHAVHAPGDLDDQVVAQLLHDSLVPRRPPQR